MLHSCSKHIFPVENSYFLVFLRSIRPFGKLGQERYLLWRKAHLHFLHENHKELWLFLSSLLQTVTALPWLQNMDKTSYFDWSEINPFLEKFPIIFLFPPLSCATGCPDVITTATWQTHCPTGIKWNQFILHYMVLLLRGLNLKFTWLNSPVAISNKSCLFLFVRGGEAALSVCYLPVMWNYISCQLSLVALLAKTMGKKLWFFCVLCEGFDCIDLGTKQKLEESKQHSFLASPRGLQYFCAKTQQLQLFTALPALWLYCSVSLQLRENLAPPYLLYPWIPTKGSSMVLFCLCPNHTLNHPRICIVSQLTYWLEHYIAIIGEGGSTLSSALGY